MKHELEIQAAAEGRPLTREEIVQVEHARERRFKITTFCSELEKTGSIKQAAQKVGWTRQHAYRLKERYPEEFEQRWNMALEAFEAKLHVKLGEAALGQGDFDGKPNIHALIQMNRAHNPELFGTTVRHEGQVKHFHTLVPMPDSLDALPLADLPALDDGLIDVEFDELDGIDDE